MGYLRLGDFVGGHRRDQCIDVIFNAPLSFRRGSAFCLGLDGNSAWPGFGLNWLCGHLLYGEDQTRVKPRGET
jgi:hypothetical protein